MEAATLVIASSSSSSSSSSCLSKVSALCSSDVAVPMSPCVAAVDGGGDENQKRRSRWRRRRRFRKEDGDNGGKDDTGDNGKDDDGLANDWAEAMADEKRWPGSGGGSDGDDDDVRGDVRDDGSDGGEGGRSASDTAMAGSGSGSGGRRRSRPRASLSLELPLDADDACVSFRRSPPLPPSLSHSAQGASAARRAESRDDLDSDDSGGCRIRHGHRSSSPLPPSLQALSAAQFSALASLDECVLSADAMGDGHHARRYDHDHQYDAHHEATGRGGIHDGTNDDNNHNHDSIIHDHDHDHETSDDGNNDDTVTMPADSVESEPNGSARNNDDPFLARLRASFAHPGARENSSPIRPAVPLTFQSKSASASATVPDDSERADSATAIDNGGVITTRWTLPRQKQLQVLMPFEQRRLHRRALSAPTLPTLEKQGEQMAETAKSAKPTETYDDDDDDDHYNDDDDYILASSPPRSIPNVCSALTDADSNPDADDLESPPRPAHLYRDIFRRAPTDNGHRCSNTVPAEGATMMATSKIDHRGRETTATSFASATASSSYSPRQSQQQQQLQQRQQYRLTAHSTIGATLSASSVRSATFSEREPTTADNFVDVVRRDTSVRKTGLCNGTGGGNFNARRVSGCNGSWNEPARRPRGHARVSSMPASILAALGVLSPTNMAASFDNVATTATIGRSYSTSSSTSTQPPPTTSSSRCNAHHQQHQHQHHRTKTLPASIIAELSTVLAASDVSASTSPQPRPSQAHNHHHHHRRYCSVDHSSHTQYRHPQQPQQVPTPPSTQSRTAHVRHLSPHAPFRHILEEAGYGGATGDGTAERMLARQRQLFVSPSAFAVADDDGGVRGKVGFITPPSSSSSLSFSTSKLASSPSLLKGRHEKKLHRRLRSLPYNVDFGRRQPLLATTTTTTNTKTITSSRKDMAMGSRSVGKPPLHNQRPLRHLSSFSSASASASHTPASAVEMYPPNEKEDDEGKPAAITMVFSDDRMHYFGSDGGERKEEARPTSDSFRAPSLAEERLPTTETARSEAISRIKPLSSILPLPSLSTPTHSSPYPDLLADRPRRQLIRSQSGSFGAGSFGVTSAKAYFPRIASSSPSSSVRSSTLASSYCSSAYTSVLGSHRRVFSSDDSDDASIGIEGGIESGRVAMGDDTQVGPAETIRADGTATEEETVAVADQGWNSEQKQGIVNIVGMVNDANDNKDDDEEHCNKKKKKKKKKLSKIIGRKSGSNMKIKATTSEALRRVTKTLGKVMVPESMKKKFHNRGLELKRSKGRLV